MRNRDIVLDGFVLTFGFLGLFSLFSVSEYYFIYQSIFLIISFVLYFLSSIYVYKNKDLYLTILFIIILISLLFLYLFGVATRGSASWISLGVVNFQPAEFAKITTVFFTSKFLSGNGHLKHKFKMIALINIPILTLIFLQPDFGNFFVVVFSIFFILFIGFLDFKKFIGILILSILLLFITYTFILQNYQKQRINSFLLQNNNDGQVNNYNLDQSKIAIGSGGLFGKGLKNNTQVTLNFLPEPHTDFIFPAVLEIYGFMFGLILLIFICAFTFWIYFKYLNTSQNVFNMYFASGVLAIYLMQVILNIGMTVGIMPITGLTLPFISYGGSSLISLYILFGILQGFNLNKMLDI